MKHYQRLKAVNGSLVICDPSTATLRVLNAAGLALDFSSPLILQHQRRLLRRGCSNAQRRPITRTRSQWRSR
jgi:hypothetical protein